MDPILIIGQNGQLSRALKRSLLARKVPYKIIGSAQLDLSKNPEAVCKLIETGTYAAVINCSAYTHVDNAEKDKQAAEALNATAPAKMAETCAAWRIPFVHISTDYVFDGKATLPYEPNHPVNPINHYGATKARGERAVLAAGGKSVVLRTSWVYDGTGKNFLTTMLKLAQTHKELSIVDDQIGRPTYAGHLAEACITALQHMSDIPKIYHVTNSGPAISWADFAEHIFKLAGISPVINRISTAKFNAPAPRPAFSVLSVEDFERDFSYPLQSWQDGLEQAMKERT